MRRTLLAVGIAVLVSMLFTPHKTYWRSLGRTFLVIKNQEDYARYEYLLWSSSGVTSFAYVPDWCRVWHWFPVFWIEDGNPVLWANGAGQTAFLAGLAAVLANLRKRPRREKAPTPST